MKFLANIFLKGLLVVLPLVITFGLLFWLFNGAEQMLRIPLQAVLPSGWYVPGMGVVSAFGLIFVCGVLVQNYFTKHLFALLEWVLGNIPVVKTLYGSARDLMHFAIGNKEKDMQKVVCVTFQPGVRLIGFVTNENATLNAETGLLAVYFPMSLQMGGYLAYVDKDKCEWLDIPVDKAMQQVLTADMTAKNTK
ncbi:DUF502 domain-containing protein [Saccharophagus degradans]|uniref:DUF502 domain-containing protein n=1 Tax=Saccharophagus degradans TaxID=86304 RepID=UPI001C08954B|nr:DUF502 domain-containing protein [Saccharophagus degradans]MBU2984770.1 DUF502 domain-containing protein [Saccharophagus degradans]WGO99808.1 DUF502 domain-containing protein [Saccharophagus degradans]